MRWLHVFHACSCGCYLGSRYILSHISLLIFRFSTQESGKAMAKDESHPCSTRGKHTAINIKSKSAKSSIQPPSMRSLAQRPVCWGVEGDSSRLACRRKEVPGSTPESCSEEDRGARQIRQASPLGSKASLREKGSRFLYCSEASPNPEGLPNRNPGSRSTGGEGGLSPGP